MVINVGLVGPKAYLKGEVDGQQVNIPVQHYNRKSESGCKLNSKYFLRKTLVLSALKG